MLALRKSVLRDHQYILSTHLPFSPPIIPPDVDLAGIVWTTRPPLNKNFTWVVVFTGAKYRSSEVSW